MKSQENWIRAKELSEKYNFNFSRLWKWAKKGWVKSKVVRQELEWETGRKKRWKVKTIMDILYIEENSFLDIPTFIRNKKWVRKN